MQKERNDCDFYNPKIKDWSMEVHNFDQELNKCSIAILDKSSIEKNSFNKTRLKEISDLNACFFVISVVPKLEGLTGEKFNQYELLKQEVCDGAQFFKRQMPIVENINIEYDVESKKINNKDVDLMLAKINDYCEKNDIKTIHLIFSTIIHAIYNNPMDDYFKEAKKSNTVEEFCKAVNGLSKKYNITIDVSTCISNIVKEDFKEYLSKETDKNITLFFYKGFLYLEDYYRSVSKESPEMLAIKDFLKQQTESGINVNGKVYSKDFLSTIKINDKQQSLSDLLNELCEPCFESKEEKETILIRFDNLCQLSEKIKNPQECVIEYNIKFNNKYCPLFKKDVKNYTFKNGVCVLDLKTNKESFCSNFPWEN